MFVLHSFSAGSQCVSGGQARDPRLLVGRRAVRDLGVAGAGQAEYEAYKEERGDILWKALENCIPDARERAEFHIVGSRWRMRRSCGGTGARTAWRGPRGRRRRTRGC